MKINWKIRFSRNNITFIVRFVTALLIPLIGYLGLEFQDLTSWGIVWSIILQALLNPYVLVLMAINACNVIADPTTQGLNDSERAMQYQNLRK